MPRNTALLLAAGLIGIVAVMAQRPPFPQAWPIQEAPPEFGRAISQADLIVISLQDALLRELREGLARGGPAAAIRSCHVDTIGLAQRLAWSEGIEAGRTSDRLRNQQNAPRPWAAPIVAGNAGRRAEDVPGFVVDLGPKLGVLRPIAEGPMCRSCHGPQEGIDPAVRRTLAGMYPRDRAVGFARGEIRGWFWVEMPKEQAARRRQP
jgi:hypothetical protein